MSTHSAFAYAAPSEWLDSGLVESDDDFAVVEPARGRNADRRGATLGGASVRRYSGTSGQFVATAITAIVMSFASAQDVNFAASVPPATVESNRESVSDLHGISDQPLTDAQWIALSADLKDPPPFNARVMALLGARI